MQLIGAHMSIAGGVHRAIDRATELGCTAMQIFVKNARRLFEKPLDEKKIALWHEKMKRNVIIRSVIAHAGYLINLATPEQEKWERYIDAMMEEMSRCDALNIKYIALHPGSPHNRGVEWGIERVAQAIDRIYESADFNVDIAIETTAGTGSNIGWRFEHIAQIIGSTKKPDRIKVVYDTCHTYAAGYDITTEPVYQKTWSEFGRIIGFGKLVALHINDSKHSFGSHKDRHQHIGYGVLGIKPFQLIMNDGRFAKLPKILETPKENDWDRKNLRLLWQLAGEEPPVNL